MLFFPGAGTAHQSYDPEECGDERLDQHHRAQNSQGSDEESGGGHHQCGQICKITPNL